MPGIVLVYQETKEIFDYLATSGISYIPNTIIRDYNSVTWDRKLVSSEFIVEHKNESTRTYIHWLATSNYSAVLHDGSLLQVTYFFEKNKLVRHRLSYVPCPLPYDFRSIQLDTTLDEYILEGLQTNSHILMKSQIRFDFDAKMASPSHPESHLSINSINCRIACASPLRVGRFVKFIFKNFYPEIYDAHPKLQGFPQNGWFPNRIDPAHSSDVHVNWPSK